MTVGEVIRAKRKEAGMTQADLAAELFVSRQLISKWETERGYPDLDQLVALSDFFAISIDYLLKGDQKVVKELTLDTKKKRMLQGALVLLGILLVVVATYLVLLTMEGPLLQRDDLEIVSVERTLLSGEISENHATKQQIEVPEDIVYKIKVRTKRPFVNLAHINVIRNRTQDEAIQFIAFGEYGLWGNQKEGILTIASLRMEDFTGEKLNIGKDLYLLDLDKSKKAVHEELPDTIENTSELLLKESSILK